ncbi:Uncharacterised protein [Mycobacteroides abscessus subsp. abscessus]|nr:Uncharacterised protein [Mycobacteroides abscessus subsp. abscessus]
MNGMRPAYRPGRSLRQPDIPNLPLLNQLGHRPDGVLDGDIRVDTMLVVEIDVVNTEPP